MSYRHDPLAKKGQYILPFSEGLGEGERERAPACPTPGLGLRFRASGVGERDLVCPFLGGFPSRFLCFRGGAGAAEPPSCPEELEDEDEEVSGPPVGAGMMGVFP